MGGLEGVGVGVGQGLALGAVLAVAAAWSRSVRPGPLPHVGVGALAGVAVAMGARLSALPAAAVVLAVVVAGGVLGRLALWLDSRTPQESPAALADAAVLAAAIACVGLLAPLDRAPFGSPPLGGGALPTGAQPLGGVPGALSGVAAVALGATAAVALVTPRVGRVLPGGLTAQRRWLIAGAALCGSAALAGGVVSSPDPDAAAMILAGADPVGMAVRSTAAALAGRGRATEAAAAGLGLGLAEALVRLLDPTGATVLLPAIGVGILAVLSGWRPDGPLPGAEQP